MQYALPFGGWSRRLVVLVAAISATPATAASLSLASPLQLRAGKTAGMVTELEFNQPQYESLKPLTTVALSDFLLPDGRRVTLELARFDIFSADAQVVLGTASGDVPMPRPEVQLFRGRVGGVEGSRVFLALSPHGNNGHIVTPNATYVVASKPGDGFNSTVIYDPAKLPAGALIQQPFTCGLDTPPGAPLPAGANADNVDAPTPRGGTCRVVKIAVDTDYEYTNNEFAGNTTNAQAYIATLLGAVSEIYVNEVSVQFEVVFSRVWGTNTDPYPSPSNVNNRLGELGAYWGANMGFVQRNVTHMLTGFCGPAGGIAYLSVLCGDGYSVSGCLNGSFPYPLVNNNSQNWDVVVVAHELGHNFGAPHTHSTSPPIDGCGSGDCSLAGAGTIMSYCHTCSGGMSNISLVLHPRIINENIMPYLNSIPSCVVESTDITFLDQPDNVQVNQGQLFQLSVVADGSPPLSYQWRRNGANVLNGLRISGATTSTVTVTNSQFTDGGNWDCMVSSQCGPHATDVAVVSIIIPAPVITQNPDPVTLCVGGAAEFTLNVTAAAPRSFQWRKNFVNLEDQGNVSGVSTGLLTINPVTIADVGMYDCVVTNLGGSTPTAQAKLLVGGDMNGDGMVNGDDIQPFVTALLNGESVTLSNCWADLDANLLLDATDATMFAELLQNAP